ncbi:GNAT family protein [Sphingorhabdus sp. Alg239-R122]|uniref:GNAT family N-acetyltransferase n=1 Tax=Sphingorhabdus sp. Alg239-R122 TaxID=2305989 RepID=UPI0013DCA2FF|nr:GNAT family protein [Sphingorhabdus sp. Alg239-R122]
MADIGGLSCTLQEGDVRLEPLADRHIEPLRVACAEDREIWEIFPVSLIDDFDETIKRMHATNDWVRFAVINEETDKVVGMTNYIRPDVHGVVEIGGTYIAPSVRGTGFNRIMKKLLIDHAFASGFRKIEFRVDTRNKRSMAAVLKLGAKQEGILRKNLVTWTGYVRDSAVFGLMQDEWNG